MRTILCLVLVAALVTRAATAPESLDAVRGARARLGGDVWSRVLEIENAADAGVYPKITYALAFEFNGMLWFYAPYDGTQSLSLHVGRLEAEKADLQPLLAEIHPGFVRFHEPADAEPSRAYRDGELPNGCFIDSLVAARELLATGQRVSNAGILLYYAKGQGSRQGHAVLAYETEAGVFVDDSERVRPQKVMDRWTQRPMDIARRHERSLRGKLVDAKLVPLRVDEPAMKAIASVGGRDEGRGFRG